MYNPNFLIAYQCLTLFGNNIQMNENNQFSTPQQSEIFVANGFYKLYLLGKLARPKMNDFP